MIIAGGAEGVRSIRRSVTAAGSAERIGSAAQVRGRSGTDDAEQKNDQCKT